MPKPTGSPPNTPTTTSPPSLSSRLHELVAACLTGLWIETHEPDESIREIASISRTEH